MLLTRRRWDMATLSRGLLRAGLELKLSHVKLATQSYLRDQTNRATGAITAYAIAAGLYAAAGIFLIAACLVGTSALFRWVEVKYGLFPAFGAVGALLLVAASICLALAVTSVKRPSPRFPSLASRLRVAIKSHVVDPDRMQAVPDTASVGMRAPSAKVRRIQSSQERVGLPISAGLILAATLLGWAAARRRQQARRI